MERIIDVYVLNVEDLLEKADQILPEIAPYYVQKYNKAKAEGVKRHELGAGILLSRCLNVKEDFQLSFGEHGKPILNIENNDNTKEFNLSHSGKYVVLAVSDDAVGADIEQIKRLKLPVLKRVLHPCFYEQIEADYEKENAKSESDGKLILGKSWTILEAVLKASGTGFITEEYNQEEFFDGWHTRSTELDGEYVISCASRTPFSMNLIPMTV
ncbi:MAG: 4'-phosphopantetheinyl transferase superfamily protein [Butyrivibrio sp.]|nr:4'-phosphopantetheinyl transferase superfamily protein [Butyrivibrio sp.]